MFNSFHSAVCAILTEMSLMIPDPRPRERMKRMGIGLLCGDAPKTITSAIEWNATEKDWSADYRLFSKTKWDEDNLFKPILKNAVAMTTDGPVFSAMDDTLVRKTGRKIPGTAYARDPLSPPFHVNLVLGQRFLQTVVMARAEVGRPHRAIPVAFRHAPPLKTRPRATEQEKRLVREARKKHNMSVVGAEELRKLRSGIDALPGGFAKPLVTAVDGSFANRLFLGKLPKRTTVVARIRKNARLRAKLPKEKRVGPRKYGEHLPTPEEMLADPTIPTREMTISVGGRTHTVKCKVINDVCWQRTTRDRPGKLILLKPLGYRLRKGSKLLYRQPGYLFVTGDEISVDDAIKAYMLRWEIEVAFRDEKTILGTGKAQVWNELSVGRAPAFMVACYAALLLGSIFALKDQRNDQFDPLAKWRTDEPLRPSTRDLVRLLKKQIAAERNHKQKTLDLAA